MTHALREWMDERQVLGFSGEELACAELARRGYAIIERRYRTRAGEIDIVARDGPTMVFVEVKTRMGGAFGSAAVAVTAWKQRQVARLAQAYLSSHGLLDGPCRFDVVAVDVDGAKATVTVYRNAFP